MKTNDLCELKMLAEKLTEFHGTLEVQPDANSIYSLAHQKAYQRLQEALTKFREDPRADNSKSILYAMENYQTANEMMMLKVQNTLDHIGTIDTGT